MPLRLELTDTFYGNISAKHRNNHGYLSLKAQNTLFDCLQK